jgi:hypothetical protein
MSFGTNEIDEFAFRARRKPEQYSLVLREFATPPWAQRRGFMFRNLWGDVLVTSAPSEAISEAAIFFVNSRAGAIAAI